MKNTIRILISAFLLIGVWFVLTQNSSNPQVIEVTSNPQLMLLGTFALAVVCIAVSSIVVR